MTGHFQVPGKLEPVQVLSFLKSLQPVRGASRYEFDFSRTRAMRPFGMLVLASGLRRFRESLPNCRFVATNYEGLGYAAHMGLWRAMGIRFGKKPGEAPGSNAYLPITVMSGASIRAAAKQSTISFNETLELQAEKLSCLLLQRRGGGAVDLLTFSLREVMRNVFEHSKCDELTYCGQYWPTYELVEVAICDDGIGIRQSLSGNPFVEIGRDVDALKAALLPGISGKVYGGRRASRNDDWANSGYGLFMISGLSRTAGRFVFASGDGALIAKGTIHRSVKTSFQGTALSFQLRVGADIDFNKELAELRRQGSAVARGISGAIVTPSAASAMLRRPSSFTG